MLRGQESIVFKNSGSHVKHGMRGKSSIKSKCNKLKDIKGIIGEKEKFF